MLMRRCYRLLSKGNVGEARVLWTFKVLACTQGSGLSLCTQNCMRPFRHNRISRFGSVCERSTASVTAQSQAIVLATTGSSPFLLISTTSNTIPSSRCQCGQPDRAWLGPVSRALKGETCNEIMPVGSSTRTILRKGHHAAGID